jgi:putative copper resistance protein D
MGQETLIGGTWYPDLSQGAMGAWLPNAHTDQQLAGGILWSSGDAIGLLFFAVIFVQWVRASMAEAKREDRRLDLLEAREARAARAAAAVAAPSSGAEPGTTSVGGAPAGDGGR